MPQWNGSGFVAIVFIPTDPNEKTLLLYDAQQKRKKKEKENIFV